MGRAWRVAMLAALLAAAMPARAADASAAVEAAVTADTAEPARALPQPRNGAEAVAALCERARRGDATSQYELAWIFAHGQGADRRDDWASYLFFAAASQGHVEAKRMLEAVTWPPAEAPDCLTRRSAVGHPSVAPTVTVKAPPAIDKLVRRLAPQFRVDPHLALTIIAVESNFDAYAVSRSAAMGLMQLIPQTARRFGVKNAFDAQQNIRGGLAYLRWLLAYYEGDVRLVAAAYNAGEGAVDRHRGIPPFEETRDYVQRVLARFGSATQAFDARVTPPSPQLREMRAAAR